MSERALPTDPEARRRAAAELAEQATAADLPLLLAFLGDDHWRVRKTAVTAFRRLPPAQAVPVLIGCLQDEANAGLRNSALEALQAIGEEAVPAIHRALREVDPDVRIALIGLIGQMGHSDSVPYILFYLGHSDRNTVAAAVAALGEIRDPSATEVLVKQMQGADDWLAVQIIDALGEIGDAAALPSLTAVITAPGPRRRAACTALGRIGTTAAADTLLATFVPDQKPLAEAILALDRIHARWLRRPKTAGYAAELRRRFAAAFPREQREELARMLGRAQPPAQGALLRAAAWLADPALLAPLFASVRPGDLGEGERAALAVLPEAPHALAAAFQLADSPERQTGLATLLAELRTPAAAPDLLVALGSEDPRLRDAVIPALAACGGEPALLPLVECAVRDEGSVAAVVTACREILRRTPATMDLLDRRLESLLLSPDAAARRLAVALAAALRPELLAGHRARLLHDQDAGVRRTAIENAGAAGILPDDLRGMMLDEAPAVRRQALRMVRQLAPDPALEALALSDADLWVRADAAASLAAAGAEAVERGFANLAQWPEPVSAAFIAALPADAVRARVAALAALAGDPRGEVARAAVEALARARLREAVPFLLSGVDSPRPARVVAALECANAPEFAELSPAVTRRLDAREDPVIRRQALAALGAMLSPAGVAAALRLLEDETLGGAAAEYLARIRPHHPGVIRDAAQTCPPRVRALARELLGDSA